VYVGGLCTFYFLYNLKSFFADETENLPLLSHLLLFRYARMKTENLKNNDDDQLLGSTVDQQLDQHNTYH
jgi:hypothetical protein